MNQAEFDRIVGAPGVPSNPSLRLPKTLLDLYLHDGCSLREIAFDYQFPIEQVEWGIRIGWLLEQLEGK